MKKLGLIGGVGPESSIEYYRMIIKQFQEKLKTKDYPELMIHSVNMTEMLNYALNDQPDELVDFLYSRIKSLELSGVDYCAIASNTPHIVFDRLVERTTLPLISIVEATCKKIRDNKMHRIGLFGTKLTMTNDFYYRVAKKYNIEILVPGVDMQDYIHYKYMNELVFNVISPSTKQKLIQIAEELKERESIQGLIFGGTELSLILNQSDLKDIVIFDTAKIHVESIVTIMIEA